MGMEDGVGQKQQGTTCRGDIFKTESSGSAVGGVKDD